jgi:hypothetical protein
VSKSHVLLLTFNALAMMMAVVGLTAQDLDSLGLAAALALVALAFNSASVLRGRASEGRAEPRVRELLDLDARLQALEGAESERQWEMTELTRGIDERFKRIEAPTACDRSAAPHLL